MTVGDDERLVGIDVIGVLRRHDRIQRRLRVRQLGLQRGELCELIAVSGLKLLAFAAQQLNGGVALDEVAGSEPPAVHVAADRDAECEEHKQDNQPKAAAGSEQGAEQSRKHPDRARASRCGAVAHFCDPLRMVLVGLERYHFNTKR